MKFYASYFGCRTNQAEIQELIIQLENSGYRLTNNISEADFGILNTCSVTEKAEKDVFRYLNKIYKKTNIKWIITGCTVNKESQFIKDKFNNYLFFSNKEKSNLLKNIKKTFPVENNIIYHSPYRSRIFLKIQDGCNFRCSFCIVPFLRGKSSSMPSSEVVKKVRYLSSLGYREVVISGINLSSYGYDLFPRENLLILIKKLNNIKNIDFIRLSSLDPRFIEYKFIREISYLEKIATSFHFSFQSGSNAVLRRMNRGSKTNDYLKIANDFYKFFPKANFGADIIVGFPQESQKEFSETVDFVKMSHLNYLHIFPFSPRPGTKAAHLDKIPFEIVSKRIKELREINKNLKFKYREGFLNETVDGIIIEENQNHCQVISKNFLLVQTPLLKGHKKKKVTIMIKRILDENTCEGIFAN